jgi:hypothetical protein
MSAESALRAVLVADATVAALVGQRVRAERAEEDDVRPFVVFTRTGTEPYTDITGLLLASQVSLDVQCWANTRTAADALADAVSAAVRAVPTQTVQGRSGGYDPDLDCEVTLLNVLWWE